MSEFFDFYPELEGEMAKYIGPGFGNSGNSNFCLSGCAGLYAIWLHCWR